jgi:hypothetical protein
MLKEEAQSILVPDFFTSVQGLEAELNGAYAGMRSIYGGGSIGTDEFYTSDVVLGSEKSTDTYDPMLNPALSVGPWTGAFVYINSCNGIIQNGSEISMDESRRAVMLAEAKFLRGQYYFAMVQNYGAVPLDLGSGKLAYNSNPSTLSQRDPVSEVYDVIISDFTTAVADLPIKASQVGRGTKAAALYFLSKAYLTRATSEAKQSDDYANAFKYADELIRNQEQYGTALQQDYADVNAEGHEADPEVLFTAQHTHDYVFGGGHATPWLYTAGYENCRVNSIAVVPRSIRYQRPWRMYVTTPHLIWEAFAEKKYDSRWDNSFRLMWECGVSNLESVGLKLGDPGILLYFEGDDISSYPEACVKYKIEELFDANGFYKHSFVNYMYPTLYKFDDTKRMALNDMSYRPYIIARLGEVYLIAAEALIMQGKKTEAADYLNVLRHRAAYRPSLSAAELTEAMLAMEIKDPSSLDIDFILDERTRELCGEQSRWLDLVRTHKLVERVKAHNPQGAPYVQSYHELRPIPQSQIDLMSDDAQKAAYQNPGYK